MSDATTRPSETDETRHIGFAPDGRRVSGNKFGAWIEPKNQHDTLIELVEQWAADRGILAHSTPAAQLLKTVSELGELADATIKGRPDEVVDGIGDVLVTLIIYAKLQGVTIGRCLAAAYDQIKDRRGRMVEGGVFVKEGDE